MTSVKKMSIGMNDKKTKIKEASNTSKNGFKKVSQENFFLYQPHIPTLADIYIITVIGKKSFFLCFRPVWNENTAKRGHGNKRIYFGDTKKRHPFFSNNEKPFQKRFVL